MTLVMIFKIFGIAAACHGLIDKVDTYCRHVTRRKT